MTKTFNMPLYGNHTIAELIETIEAVDNAKVTKVTMSNDYVTLYMEPIESEQEIVEGNEADETEDCFECGGTCNYHEDWCVRNEP